MKFVDRRGDIVEFDPLANRDRLPDVILAIPGAYMPAVIDEGGSSTDGNLSLGEQGGT